MRRNSVLGAKLLFDRKGFPDWVFTMVADGDFDKDLGHKSIPLGHNVAAVITSCDSFVAA